MPVDAASIRASLSLDDQQFQQGMAQARQSMATFAQASQAAAVTSKELDRALNANAAFGKQLTEVQKQQLVYTKELTAERIRHAQQLAGEGKLAQDLGARFNLLTNEQRAILQATKEATAAWGADQRALAAHTKAQEAEAAAAVKTATAEAAAAVQATEQAAAAQARAAAQTEVQLGRTAAQVAGLQANILGIPPAAAGLLAVAGGMKFILDAAVQDTEALNTLKAETGATGKEFENLRASMERVHKQVPNDLQDVAHAIALLHARTGETGPALEELAKRELIVARILHTDLNKGVEDSAKLFKQWGLSVSAQVPALDLIMKAHQRTGVEFNKLQEDLIKYGPLLRNMGLSFAGAAAQVATLEQSHVDLGRAIAPLRQAMAKFAKEGVADPAQALLNLEQRIKDAKTEGEAFGIAAQIFGARGGTDLAREIREGHLEVGNLKQALLDSKGAITNADKDVDSLAKRFDKMKQNLQDAVKPLGHDLEEMLKGWVGTINTDVIPVLDRLTHAIHQAGQEVKAGKPAPATASIGTAALSAAELVAPFTTFSSLKPLFHRAADMLNPPVLPDVIGLAARGGPADEAYRAARAGAGARELDIAKTPPGGGKTPFLGDTKQRDADIKALTRSIAEEEATLRTYDVTSFNTTVNVSKLSLALRKVYAEHLAAPEALRMHNVALLAQIAAYRDHEKAATKSAAAQAEWHKKAQEAIAGLKAETADLTGGSKLQKFMQTLSGASPQDKAAAEEAFKQRDLRKLQLKEERDAADKLAGQLGKLDSSYQSNRLEGLLLAASTDKEVYSLRVLGLELSKVPASLKASLDAGFKMEQATLKQAEAFRIAREQASAYLNLFKVGDEAVRGARVELDKSTAALNLQGDQLRLETTALDQYKKHFLELPGALQIATMAYASLQKQAEGTALSLDKVSGEKAGAGIWEGKASPEETRLGNPETLARQFEDYYVRVIEPLNRTAERQAQQAAEFTSRLADGVQQSFTHVFSDLATNGFGGLFKSIRQSFSQMLVSMASDYLGSQVRRALLGDIGGPNAGMAGSSRGLLGSLFGAVAGAATGGGGGTTDASQLVGSLAGFGGSTLTAADTAGITSVSRNRGMAAAPAAVQHVTNVHMVVHATDAGSFRQNQNQIHADMFRAASRFNRRGGG